MKWVPTTHTLADTLTSDMPMNETFWKFYESLSQNKAKGASEEHRRLLSTTATTAPKGAPKHRPASKISKRAISSVVRVLHDMDDCIVGGQKSRYMFRRWRVCFRLSVHAQIFSQPGHVTLQRSGPTLHPQFHSVGLCICFVQDTLNIFNISHSLVCLFLTASGTTCVA